VDQLGSPLVLLGRWSAHVDVRKLNFRLNRLPKLVVLLLNTVRGRSNWLWVRSAKRFVEPLPSHDVWRLSQILLHRVRPVVRPALRCRAHHLVPSSCTRKTVACSSVLVAGVLCGQGSHRVRIILLTWYHSPGCHRLRLHRTWEGGRLLLRCWLLLHAWLQIKS